MNYEIGETAGRVWEVLNSSGAMSLSQLKKKMGGSADLVNQALGWLARENKVNIVKKGNSVKITLI